MNLFSPRGRERRVSGPVRRRTGRFAPSTIEALPAQLADIHAREPDRRVVLKGDGTLDYQKVRDVFAVVQAAGFSGVSLQVQKRGSGKEEPEEAN